MQQQYSDLKARWLSGSTDRDAALELLFYAWMHWAEPPFATELKDDSQAASLWLTIFEQFGGETSIDIEFLWISAIMTSITPWAFGDEVLWKHRSDRLRARISELKASIPRPETFEGRGDYGEYFAHQASVHLR